MKCNKEIIYFASLLPIITELIINPTSELNALLLVIWGISGAFLFKQT